MNSPITKMRMMLKRPLIIQDKGNYDIGKGEMNPEIVSEFLRLLMDKYILSPIWEPCAGHTGNSLVYHHCAFNGFRLIAYDIAPKDGDWWVHRADSTKTGPGEPIGGMIFHPPYFGCVPFSSSDGEISMKGELDYRKALLQIIENGKSMMIKNGMVCAVCRDYQMHGKPIRLSEWFIEWFISAGFELETVWSSLPDIILVFRKLS